MARGASYCHCLSFCVLIIGLCICSSGFFAEASPLGKHGHREGQDQIFHTPGRHFFDSFRHKTIQSDEIYPPTTTIPTMPVTVFPTPPTIITVPSTNPVNLTPNPDSVPDTVPSTTPGNSPLPITNPVTTPAIMPPVTNPVTTYPAPSTGVPATTPVTNPGVVPPAAGGSSALPGQSWCVARSGVSEAALQAALDYACGIGGADCSAIQQGGSCYNPISLQYHASYAFNSYYQKNPVQTSCDFGGCAMVTTANPSTGTCIYPTSGSPSSTPTTATNPTPTTASSGGGTVPGSISPPSVLNSGNPAPVDSTAGFGETPPGFNSSTSMSIGLQPFVGLTILAASVVIGRFVLHV